MAKSKSVDKCADCVKKDVEKSHKTAQVSVEMSPQPIQAPIVEKPKIVTKNRQQLAAFLMNKAKEEKLKRDKNGQK